MNILLHRIYDGGAPQGYRVLVDRLWPRGISKQKAHLDEWCKALAPSTELRQWFGHDASKWAEFRSRYLHELGASREAARALLSRAHPVPLLLLYGAKDIHHTHAIVLKGFLETLAEDEPREYASPPCYAHAFKEP